MRLSCVWLLTLAMACSDPGVNTGGTGAATGTGATGGSGASGGSGATGGTAGSGAGGTAGRTGGSGGGGGFTVMFADAGSTGGSGGLGPNADERDCGKTKYTLEKKPAELMLVLDRSGSMMDPLKGPPPLPNKWDPVVAALDAVIMQTQALVYWGLAIFPRIGQQCDVAKMPDFPLQLNAYTPIMTFIKNPMTTPVQRQGGTPTREGMRTATAYLKTRTTTHPKYIVLATDGRPSCINPPSDTTDDPVGSRMAVMEAAAAGFHTFVVGIATLGTRDHDMLNVLAMEGKEARTDPVAQYYPVASKDELVSALNIIVGQVLTCNFALPMAPPDPDNVAVDLDIGRAPRDTAHIDGWDFGSPDMKSIVLYGKWCDSIKNGTSKNVGFRFGCKDVPIP